MAKKKVNKKEVKKLIVDILMKKMMLVLVT